MSGATLADPTQPRLHAEVLSGRIQKEDTLVEGELVPYLRLLGDGEVPGVPVSPLGTRTSQLAKAQVLPNAEAPPGWRRSLCGGRFARRRRAYASLAFERKRVR